MTKNFHELERERHEAREKVKQTFVKSAGFESMEAFNELQKSNIELWLSFWVEIHTRLEALGLATSITNRSNFIGLVEDETEAHHLNSDEFCRVYPMESRNEVTPLTNKRPKEWFYVE